MQKNASPDAKKPRRKRRIFIYALVFLLLAIIAFAAFEFALYFSFIIGQDILVRVQTNTTAIDLPHGQIADARFAVSTLNGLFCFAACQTSFIDITNNLTLGNRSFTMRQGETLDDRYPLKVDTLGSGLALYRYIAVCKNEKSWICRSQETSRRDILVSVRYNESATDTLVRRDTQYRIGEEERKLMRIDALSVQNQLNVQLVSGAISTQDIAQDNFAAGAEVSGLRDMLQIIRSAWEGARYYEAADMLDKQEVRSNAILLRFLDASERMHERITSYNHFVARLNELRGVIIDLSAQRTYTNPAKEMIQQVSSELMDVVRNVGIPRDEAGKSMKVEALERRVADAESANILGQARDIRFISDDIAQVDAALCVSGAGCGPYYENTVDSTIEAACQRLARARARWEALRNASWNSSSVNVSGIQAALHSIPGPCPSPSPLNIPPVSISSFEETLVPAVQEIQGLTEAPPQCCIFGRCHVCCAGDSCGEDPALYPVLFLHGHALSANISTDYSLNTFNGMQDTLEADGFLDAGAVSLYTRADQDGRWDMIPSPLSIKASYYHDSLLNQQDYVYITTKSETIDTYAVRLKEIIDTVARKTGRPKVRIVAHSMGGLVARRYIQLFGEERIDRIVFIGTPHEGIKGDVRKYCPVIGAARECADMDEESSFMSKLNDGHLPTVPMLNIVGSGCDMQGEDGDGVVTRKSAALDGTANFIEYGSCSALKKLHNELTKPHMHPSVYEAVVGFLDG